MSRRSLIILGIFILVVVGIIVASQIISNQPPIEITLAVDPLAEAWVRQVVTEFNDENILVNNTRRVRISIITISDMDVWRGDGSNEWTPEDHPDMWIASHSATLGYARNANIPMQTLSGSTARTVLVWGGHRDRVDVLTNNGATSLDWGDVVQATGVESWEALGGQSSWQFVDLAFALPDRTMAGLAVLLSGASAFNETPMLDTNAVRNNALFDWLQSVISSVPNFNTIGDDVGAFFARSSASADIALTVESHWLTNLDSILRDGDITLSYPEYPFVFDFPLAQWEDDFVSGDVRAGIRAFNDFLLNSESQNATVDFGLRPANSNPDSSASLFTAGEAYGIQLSPMLDNPIQPPSANDVQILLQQFQIAQRR